MYQSGKERNDERNQESNAANQGFHNGPGLEGGFFIHADKALNKPEAGIVKVRADRGTTCDGSSNAGKIQRRQLADAGHGNAAIRALSIVKAVDDVFAGNMDAEVCGLFFQNLIAVLILCSRFRFVLSSITHSALLLPLFCQVSFPAVYT